MPNNHPYDKKSDRRQQDLNDLVDGAVNFGLGISSTVLSGIAGALDSVGDSLNRAAQRPEQNSFIAYRRKLDNSLAGHYGGWMTMGVLGWVFGGCFAIAALVMAILAGVAPNDASLWSAMPVFNILAPTFTACTLGFFVMGYAGCHAANYFGRLRRYLRGMHLNDSMKPLGSRVDRHQNLGDGFLGMTVFRFIARDKRFDGIPLILETPDESRWPAEIELLKSFEKEG